MSYNYHDLRRFASCDSALVVSSDPGFMVLQVFEVLRIIRVCVAVYFGVAHDPEAGSADQFGNLFSLFGLFHG